MIRICQYAEFISKLQNQVSTIKVSRDSFSFPMVVKSVVTGVLNAIDPHIFEDIFVCYPSKYANAEMVVFLVLIDCDFLCSIY